MANSALLVMDVQRDIVAIADDGSGYLPRLRRAIDGARAAGIPVISGNSSLRAAEAPDSREGPSRGGCAPGASPRGARCTTTRCWSPPSW